MPPPVVLVLASGRGERFLASGGQGSKLRALLAGRAVLDRTIEAARASGLPVHVEDAGHPGMGDSIAAAVRATPQAGGWLVLPGDLPLVAAQTLRQVAAALNEHQIVVPTWQGERGHPVAFGPVHGDRLMALGGALGAGRIVKQAEAGGAVHLLAVADAGIRTDIDTLQDLAAAERLLARL